MIPIYISFVSLFYTDLLIPAFLCCCTQYRKDSDTFNPPQEFATLADDANIYKLIGPVLLKQDKAEAVMNVNRRLEHIQSEM